MNKHTNGSDAHVGDIFLDAQSFTQLRHGSDMADVAKAVLQSLSRINQNFEQMVLVLSDGPSDKLQPVAAWPTGATPSREMLTAVQGTAKANRLIIETTGDAQVALAVPLSIDDKLRGVFGVAVGSTDDAAIRLAIDQVQWATGWIEALLRRRKLTDGESLSNVITLLATSLHHRRFQEAATAVATELASILDCERVAVGFIKGRHSKVRALSNSASFQKQAGLIRSIGAAMDEAVDQQAMVVFPEKDSETPRVTRAHESLAKDQENTATASFPLTEGKRVIGAITLEKTNGSFDDLTLQTAEYAAVLLGPVLDVKRRDDRWITTKIMASLGSLLGNLIGPRHWGLKLGTAALVAFIAFCYFATGTYRVTAEAVLEGKIQRSITVPLAGFLAESNARAGDIVREGELIAQLDDRDLRLERLKWASQRTQQEREYSQAIATRERTEARILDSQIQQAEAQIAVLDAQLERMNVRAPFSGVIVSGDLSQALGAPLERGDVIFEIAPLEDYRVMLRVDERDIREVEPGQTGNLALAAFPDTPVGLRTVRITPISTAAEGENFFMVEAALTNLPTQELRPGMEGVAKVAIREERLVNIWTKRTWLWLRMTAWKWWP